MTEQEKQKLKDILIEHKNIAASEYNDEDAFVGIYFDDLVDIINNIMHNIGWQPVSEKSKIKNGEKIIILFRHPASGRLLPWEVTYNGDLPFDAEWWIRKPEEE